MKFNWHNEKRRIKDLVPYVANPRQITEKQAKDLKASLERFGVADPIIINTDNTIIGGHQRKKILETLMGVDPDYEIDVRVPDRELSIDEARELNVRLNKNTGSFDFDILANNFELDDLLEWGFEKSDLDLDLFEFEDDEKYTRNIEAPIYEPKGEKPDVSDLFDDTKVKELIAEIDNSDLPDDVKSFLRRAARRHTVFNYKRIADYYAHSEQPVQALMENSALVIIDFYKAIELGYVKLAKDVAEQYGVEYGDD
jgi:hypothetical protein